MDAEGNEAHHQKNNDHRARDRIQEKFGRGFLDFLYCLARHFPRLHFGFFRLHPMRRHYRLRFTLGRNRRRGRCYVDFFQRRQLGHFGEAGAARGALGFFRHRRIDLKRGCLGGRLNGLSRGAGAFLECALPRRSGWA